MGDKEALTGGQIYFDGQPFEGIKEAEFVPELTDDAPEAPLRVADNVELTLTFTPEQAAAMVEAFKEALEPVVQAINKVIEWAREVIQQIAAAVKKTAHGFMDRMLYAANDHPKWWHLYKHAKKARTRKKYRRRLVQQLLRKLEAAAT